MQRMNGHLSSEALSAYLDGETAPAEERRLAAHLAGCLHCRSRLLLPNIGCRKHSESTPIFGKLFESLFHRSAGARVIVLKQPQDRILQKQLAVTADCEPPCLHPCGLLRARPWPARSSFAE